MLPLKDILAELKSLRSKIGFYLAQDILHWTIVMARYFLMARQPLKYLLMHYLKDSGAEGGILYSEGVDEAYGKKIEQRKYISW